MKTAHEHLTAASDRNKRIMEHQKQYYWRNMSSDKRGKILRINLITNSTLLILCILGLTIFKAFWLLSLLILTLISLGVNVFLFNLNRKSL